MYRRIFLQAYFSLRVSMYIDNWPAVDSQRMNLHVIGGVVFHKQESARARRAQLGVEVAYLDVHVRRC